jgi:uncharacterized membrane protein YesL
MKTSRLGNLLSSLIDLIWAGLLCLFCSLPFFTAGASVTALYYTIVKSIRHDRGRVSSCFFHSFRTNFRQATLIWLLCLLYILVGIGDAYAFSRMGVREGNLLYYLSRLFFLPVPLLIPWLFAFLSRFENTIGNIFRYAFYLSIRHFGITLLLGAELTALILICWMLPIFIPLLPGPFCMLMSLHIEPVFRKMTATSSSDDSWYNE